MATFHQFRSGASATHSTLRLASGGRHLAGLLDHLHGRFDRLGRWSFRDLPLDLLADSVVHGLDQSPRQRRTHCSAQRALGLVVNAAPPDHHSLPLGSCRIVRALRHRDTTLAFGSEVCLGEHVPTMPLCWRNPLPQNVCACVAPGWPQRLVEKKSLGLHHCHHWTEQAVG